MSRPVLYVFSISHYCEKARWALTHCGVDYKLRRIAPGFHRKKAKAIGAKSGSLPYFQVGKDVICGSADIIDWAEANAANGKILTPGPVVSEARDIEARLDKVLGVHVRRYYYSEAMVDHPMTVRPIFLRGLPLIEKFAVRSKWDMIRKLMIKGMDLGPEQGRESRAVIEGEMQWLDTVLSDGRPYLTGDQFTRADITAASLLAPLTIPKNHPEYAGLSLPPGVAKDCGRWRDRPSLRWAAAVYEKHR